MRYIKETLKYLKNNILLLPSLAIAILAFAPIIDFMAIERIAQSFDGGKISDSFTAWLRLFLPFNTENWITALLSIVAYVALIVNLAFIHSMVDKHIRFGIKSFRSIMSSLTINFVYGLICVIVLAVAVIILDLIMAVIMTAFCMAGEYIFIVGIVICAILAIVFLFVAAHFFLWLPCAEITGFRISEALFYSYAQARTHRWANFAAIVLPAVCAVVITALFGIFMGITAAAIAGPICFGCAFMVIVVASYMSYADAEGIEREDLKKF